MTWLYSHEYEVNECKDRQRLWDEITEGWNREKKFREIQMEKYAALTVQDGWHNSLDDMSSQDDVSDSQDSTDAQNVDDDDFWF